MDFKTRFQGKISHISKDGAIDDVVQATVNPIYKVNKITMNNFSQNDQLISYANNTQSSYKSSYSQQFSGNNSESNQQRSFNLTPNNNYDNNFQNSDSQNSPKQYKNLPNNLNDIQYDNIYLRGGNNLAEVLLQQPNGAGSGQGMSIAMRMKKNREQATQQFNQQNIVKNNIEDDSYFTSTPYNQNNQQYNPNDQQNLAAQTTKYSDNSQVTLGKSPISTQQSQRSTYAAIQNQKVEQQRSNQFTRVSKDIINNSQPRPLEKQYSQQLNTNEDVPHKNPYNHDSNLQSRQRAISVSASKQSEMQNIKEKQSISQQNNKRHGAFRSAGIRQLQKQPQEQKTVAQTQQNPASQSSYNSMATFNPQVVLPYQTNPIINPIQGPGQPQINQQAINQQMMMLQQQLLLLQQQQSLISGQPLPQTSPALLQQTSSFASQYQSQQQIQGTDVYKQLEVADEHFNHKKSTNHSHSQQRTQNINPTQSQTSNSIYQPYSVKDYKNMQNTLNSLKLGGLGANIGGEEWEKAKKKQEAAKLYAKQLQQNVVAKPIPQRQKTDISQKEKSSRDRAIEFAKNNIPKPKPRQNGISYNNELQQESEVIIEEPFDENQLTMNQDQLTLMQLNARHDAYADEIEQLKQLIM